MFTALVSLALFLLLVLALSAAYAVVFRKKEDEKTVPQIHASGSFSIVRQSPRATQTERFLSEDVIRSILLKAQITDKPGLIPAYQKLWEEQLEFNIASIEEGDRQGVQTYQYSIPPSEATLCPQLSHEIYVTREQLQNFPHLIPPFYLGSSIKLLPKYPWDTKLNGQGWKPLLPDNHGKYLTPSFTQVHKFSDF